MELDHEQRIGVLQAKHRDDGVQTLVSGVTLQPGGEQGKEREKRHGGDHERRRPAESKRQ